MPSSPFQHDFFLKIHLKLLGTNELKLYDIAVFFFFPLPAQCAQCAQYAYWDKIYEHIYIKKNPVFGLKADGQIQSQWGHLFLFLFI